jgi:diguanylate cyclase (GGDEF)-like protein/PAS domain S-box-containing protein
MEDAEVEAPGGADPDDRQRLRVAVDCAPVIILTLDEIGTITWLGGALERLTGYTPDELIGTNILDHFDTSWNPAALESVGYAFTRQGLQRPMLFKVIRKDGSSFIGEATANAQLDDPVVGGLVAYLRRWDERHLLDLVIEKLAAGSPLEETIGLLVEVMGAETLEADSAVFLQPFARRFFRVVAGPHLPAALAVDDGSAGTPWHQATLTGVPRWVAVDQLAEPLRSAAQAHGYRTCWAWPARGSGGGQACLVLWRTDDEEPDYTCRWLLDNLVRITSLVLDREQQSAQLRHAANHDVLTGLANRARFFEHLRQVLEDDRSGPLVGVLYVDLDEFKPVNDRLGHRAGDILLEEVAKRLTEAVRDHDLVARLGGDEFAVVCPGAPDEAALAAVAERLTATVCRPVTIDDESVTVGASVGIAFAPPGACSIDALVEAADAALYDAKHEHRGGYRVAASPAASGPD